MNVWRHNRPHPALLVALIAVFTCALAPGVAGSTISTGSFQIGAAGGTASVPIVLDSAPGGISGYRITVSLSNPSVATIAAVEFPGWATLKTASAVPSGQVVLQAVDLQQQVPLGGAAITLATITVQGTAAGSTGITVTPDASMGVQDRNGNPYGVTTAAGSLSVGGSTPPAPVPTTAPPGGVTTVPTVPSITVPTVIPTSVVTSTGGTTTVPTPSIPGGVLPTTVPTSDGSSSVPVIVYPVPFDTSVPVVSPVDTTGGTGGPSVITPGVRPTFSVGKRYAVGNPGTFIGTRFGAGGTGGNTTGTRTAVTIPATLKPGSRAYGITPPGGKFVRWYPEARWAAGLR